MDNTRSRIKEKRSALNPRNHYPSLLDVDYVGVASLEPRMTQRQATQEDSRHRHFPILDVTDPPDQDRSAVRAKNPASNQTQAARYALTAVAVILFSLALHLIAGLHLKSGGCTFNKEYYVGFEQEYKEEKSRVTF
jgi:hypothetical protein